MEMVVSNKISMLGIRFRNKVGPFPFSNHAHPAFNHAHQLLMNDEFLEGYFMLFGKHKDRIVIEIPVDRS